ncbi:MAG: type II toxin-antitoxin system RelE/ParE family toxin [Thermoanaerobaculia bacterium]|nr:type II toxin-antitoxin system RelE/ParE family toxin [Thermoanaerobaculia bacterium]
MSYSVKIKGSAQKALAKIARHDRLRLIAAIDRLAVEPLAGSPLKGEFGGLRRVRVGDYRIVYEVVQDQLVILVVRVGQRGDVYR